MSAFCATADQCRQDGRVCHWSSGRRGAGGTVWITVGVRMMDDVANAVAGLAHGAVNRHTVSVTE